MSLILDGTNGVSDIDGTAATPAIRGTDTNTGIFFPAADTIAFAEGGAESMRIGSDGCLNIGKTDNPTGKLDIGGQASGVATNVARFGNIAGTNNGPIVSVDASNNWLFNQASGSIRVGSTIAVGGATALYGVGGITFPATQSASSDANTLDDYEEGEFTPLINGVSLGAQTYIKIGQFVYINISAYAINVSSIGATTSLNLSGFPFTKRTGLFVLVIDQYPGIPVTLGDGTGTSSNLYTTANAQDYTAVTRNSYGGSAVMSFRFVFMYQANS
jgi:hypothetical protein